MSSGIADLDTNMPDLRGKTPEAALKMVSDYLYQLLESLRYVLNNLGKDNFNDKEYQDIRKEINGSLTITTTSGGNTATISLNRDGIQISSGDITFTGMVTFENLATSGQTVINGDNIKTGTVDGANFISRYNGPGDWSGTLTFYYLTQLLGEIIVEEANGRKYLKASTYGTNDMEAYSGKDLDLKSDNDTRITTGGKIKTESAGDTEIHADGNLKLSAGGHTVIYDSEGVSWEFTPLGIYRGTKLVFPIP